ncbi:hypothetical protein [uncultured Williamsia sp.]|uniref:hypothetical protein n=1 Tax=uncultured Williamsia sp. TaxID=259311 RepID=UPI00261BA10B|nr:hypothetical protein [uncultured Williamsia sp.]
MHTLPDSLPDPGDDGMVTLDAAASAPAPMSASVPFGAGITAASGDTDRVDAFDPERLLLGEHGGVMVIVGLLVLALVLLTVAFGALPR